MALELILKKDYKKRSGIIFLDSLELCLISPSSVVMDRSLFKTYGLFDENLIACEDYDLWLRITRKEDIGLLKESLLIRHGGHKDQLSQLFWGMDRFRIYSILKLLDRHKSEMENKFADRAKEIVLKKLDILYKGSLKRGRSDFSKTLKLIIHLVNHECYNKINYLDLLKE